MGLSDEADFVNYHRFLQRAVGSGLAVSQTLLQLLVPVHSSHSHFVKASGLRWATLMLLVPIPFAERVWALPYLTLLAPSERYL